MKRRTIGPGISFFAFQDIITAVVGIFILITLILVLELTQRVEAANSSPTVDIDQIRSTIDSLRTETQRLTQQYSTRIQEQSEVAGVNEFNRAAKVEELKAGIRAATEQVATTQDQLEQTRQRLAEEGKRQSALLHDSAQLEDERDLIAKLKQALANIDRTINRLESNRGLIYRDKTGEGRLLCILTLDSLGIAVQDAGSRVILDFRGSDWFHRFQRWLDQTDRRSRHFLLLVRPSGTPDFDRVRELLSERGCVYGFDVVANDHQVQLGFQWEAQP